MTVFGITKQYVCHTKHIRFMASKVVNIHPCSANCDSPDCLTLTARLHYKTNSLLCYSLNQSHPLANTCIIDQTRDQNNSF